MSLCRQFLVVWTCCIQYCEDRKKKILEATICHFLRCSLWAAGFGSISKFILMVGDVVWSMEVAIHTLVVPPSPPGYALCSSVKRPGRPREKSLHSIVNLIAALRTIFRESGLECCHSVVFLPFLLLLS